MTPLNLAIALVAAFAILLVVYALANSGSSKEIDERIRRYGTDQSVVAEDPHQSLSDRFASNTTLTALNRAVEKRDFGSRIARDLARADLTLKVSEYLIIWAGAIVAVPLLFLLVSPLLRGLGSPLGLAIGFLLGFLLPGIYVRRRQAARRNALNVQLPDTIVLLANGLRAGSSFLQACEMVTRDDAPPISTEFGRVVKEVNFGLPFQAAISNMVRRVESDDFALLATAVNIQYQVGGNLAEILDSIAGTIRERVRIKGEINTLTAQQRLSGYIVGFLPIGLIGFLFAVAPNFLAPMFRKPPEILGLPAGLFMLGGAGIMMLIGFWIIRRIVDIDV